MVVKFLAENQWFVDLRFCCVAFKTNKNFESRLVKCLHVKEPFRPKLSFERWRNASKPLFFWIMLHFINPQTHNVHWKATIKHKHFTYNTINRLFNHNLRLYIKCTCMYVQQTETANVYIDDPYPLHTHTYITYTSLNYTVLIQCAFKKKKKLHNL